MPFLVLLFLCLAAFFSGDRAIAAPRTVVFPLTVEYPLLQTLLIHEAFPEEKKKTTLIDEGDGCILLTLSNPRISAAKEVTRLETRVFARVGTPLGNNCFGSLEWQGHLVLYQKPKINPDTWQLSFQTVASELLGNDRQPAQIVGALWNMMEPKITGYLNDIRIDLMPPITEMKHFMLPLFPQNRRTLGQTMLDSMRSGPVEVHPDSLRLQIQATVSEVFDPTAKRASQPLDPEELQQVVAVWESWDSLLVFLITSLNETVLSEEEKQTLITVLLDARYKFVTQLNDQTLTRDIVREQFVDVWRDLDPIFRNRLFQDAQFSQALGYLAFVSSVDALLVFDQIGPAFGIEISTEGLIRLVRMLNENPDLLEYRQDVNPQLQQLIDVEAAPGTPEKQAPDVTNSQSDIIDRFRNTFRPRSAWAAQTQPSYADIVKWKVPSKDVGNYIKRVHLLLEEATEATLAQKKLPREVASMFRLLIPSMAWQESCYRQFVVKNNQLTFLRSYNQSSVGIMQINERVWRGFYALNRLRWDIRYNTVVGCEIAALYITKYGLPTLSRKKKLDEPTLARIVYAMYNGGPSERHKFPKRLERRRLYDSDKLFWEKYQLVSKGQAAQVSRCLTGS